MSAASADLRALAADLAAASGAGIESAAAEVVRDYATDTQRQAMAYAPVKTGALRSSITVRFDGPTTAIIGPQVPYGPYQEFGTATQGEFPGPVYEIRPKNAAALSFVVDGRRVVTQRVKHPGVKPKRYMRRAITDVLGPMAAELARRGALLITKGPGG
jgi:phage gpG-like protein